MFTRCIYRYSSIDGPFTVHFLRLGDRQGTEARGLRSCCSSRIGQCLQRLAARTWGARLCQEEVKGALAVATVAVTRFVGTKGSALMYPACSIREPTRARQLIFALAAIRWPEHGIGCAQLRHKLLESCRGCHRITLDFSSTPTRAPSMSAMTSDHESSGLFAVAMSLPSDCGHARARLPRDLAGTKRVADGVQRLREAEAAAASA